MTLLTHNAALLMARLADYFVELTIELRRKQQRDGAQRFRVWAEISGKPCKELKTMNLILADDQKVKLSITPVDAKGNPATVDGAPVWASSDDSIISVTADPDGMGAVAVAGKLGSAQINVTADADMGTGTTSIAGTLDVQVMGGQAVGFTINAGTPEAQ